ncbi:MAG: hypothetical protein KDD64_04515 [Bdellovibrionales bacterium]|nr:hypothetical protein [Bdellovibrionales bacterium]
MTIGHVLRLIILCCTLLNLTSNHSLAQTQPEEESQPSAPEPETSSSSFGTNPFDADFQKSPTYVSSKNLLLRSEKREITYSGNVEVLHKGMRLTCDELVAYYSEKNEIQKIVAEKNVFIEKGKEVQARSEKAVYEQATETVTLTENPEMVQNGSVLSADLIRIFLNEDRSVAEGAVRVKLLQTEKKVGKDKQAANSKTQKKTTLKDTLIHK